MERYLLFFFQPPTDSAIVAIDAHIKTYADMHLFHKSTVKERGLLPVTFLPLFLIMQIIFPQGLTAASVGTGMQVGRGSGGMEIPVGRRCGQQLLHSLEAHLCRPVVQGWTGAVQNSPVCIWLRG